MGYIKHDAVITTIPSYLFDHQHMRTWMPEPPDVDAFVASMPEMLRSLVVGPITSPTTDYVTYLFVPGGDKEGSDFSNEVAEWRQRFIDLFSVDYEGFTVVSLSYGADQIRNGGARIDHQYPTPWVHHPRLA